MQEPDFKLLEMVPDGVITVDASQRITSFNRGAEAMFQYSAAEAIGQPLDLLLPRRYAHVHRDYVRQFAQEPVAARYMGQRPMVYARRKDGQEFPADVSIARLGEGAGMTFLAVIRDVTERVQAQARIEQQLQDLASLYGLAQNLAETLDAGALAATVCRALAAQPGIAAAWLGRAVPGGRVELLHAAGAAAAGLNRLSIRWDDTPAGSGPTGQAIRSGRPVVVADVAAVPGGASWQQTAQELGFGSLAALPLISGNRPFGCLTLGSGAPGFFTTERLALFQAHAHLAAAALENARLYAEAQLRLRRTQALSTVDQAIAASLDLRVTLGVLLDQVTAQLQVDAAGVLLLNPHSQILEFAAERGLRTAAYRQTRVRLGEGLVGQAALARRTAFVPDLGAEPDPERRELLDREGVVSYAAVPLLAKGQVAGVLELFHRSLLEPSPDWLEYAETLAGQAAIAVDNARMFEELQRKGAELALAYDATLEGWARALDMRHQETEGHSRRVMEGTVRLARAMGLGEAELVHVRRGALLHDIGKMAIPDAILLKPGPLTPEEWQVMRRHPTYAMQLLAPIPFLRPALDIPYCHHEKWDGSGYPQGLQGEQIPLAARIFAVIDVWDALCSNRPYRPAWPEEQAREYIRAQAGQHFDPAVVAVFLAGRDWTR